MTDRSSQVDWVIFLLLGFFWGSSYLFIKLAVDEMSPACVAFGRLVLDRTDRDGEAPAWALQPAEGVAAQSMSPGSRT